MTPMDALLPEFFRRLDERPDALFYRRPRTASHLDGPAMDFLCEAYDAVLPPDGRVLDLMAGVRSHLCDRYPIVTGLGLNVDELHANPRIDQEVVHDLNAHADLPFGDGTFAGAVCSVSVQYMVRPLDTFASVARVLEPGAPFAVAISTRMFEQKAVLAWRASDDAAHERLVHTYFDASGAFGTVSSERHAPEGGDPVTVLWARTRDPS